MRFDHKLSLSLIFFTFFYFFPSSLAVNQCEYVVLGASIQRFGTDGKNGENGRKGEDGRDAESITIFADGSPTRLNLAGQDGSNGEDGRNAEDARCREQPYRVNHNLQAANGGIGGNGGDGGDGGNGGNITIYATNLDSLRQITVNAEAGRGGQPGQGGTGGRGCVCTEPFWTIETCQGRPGQSNYRCTTEEFRCENGINGVNGGSGRVGRNGRLGQLTLINLNRPLTDDKPSATIAFSELQNRGVTLSKNKWETRQGALSLFAPGSIIDDQYRTLIERQENSFLLVWNAPQPFEKFANQRVTISLNDDSSISAELPDSLWIEATTQEQNNVTEFVVYNAILEREVTSLVSEGISGNRNELQLTLVDRADISNLVSTKFNVRYRTTRDDPRFRPTSTYRTRYDDEFPAELISLEGNKFILNVGQLPIELDSLRPGLGIEIEVIATRSFAGYSKEQRIVIQDVIPGFR